jgi:hypothetical protein
MPTLGVAVISDAYVVPAEQNAANSSRKLTGLAIFNILK